MNEELSRALTNLVEEIRKVVEDSGNFPNNLLPRKLVFTYDKQPTNLGEVVKAKLVIKK